MGPLPSLRVMSYMLRPWTVLCRRPVTHSSLPIPRAKVVAEDTSAGDAAGQVSRFLSEACSQARTAHHTPRSQQGEHEVDSQVTPVFLWAPKPRGDGLDGGRTTALPTGEWRDPSRPVLDKMRSVLARLKAEGLHDLERKAALKRAQQSSGWREWSAERLLEATRVALEQGAVDC